MPYLNNSIIKKPLFKYGVPVDESWNDMRKLEEGTFSAKTTLSPKKFSKKVKIEKNSRVKRKCTSAVCKSDHETQIPSIKATVSSNEADEVNLKVKMEEPKKIIRSPQTKRNMMTNNNNESSKLKATFQVVSMKKRTLTTKTLKTAGTSKPAKDSEAISNISDKTNVKKTKKSMLFPLEEINATKLVSDSSQLYSKSVKSDVKIESTNKQMYPVDNVSTENDAESSKKKESGAENVRKKENSSENSRKKDNDSESPQKENDVKSSSLSSASRIAQSYRLKCMKETSDASQSKIQESEPPKKKIKTEGDENLNPDCRYSLLNIILFFTQFLPFSCLYYDSIDGSCFAICFTLVLVMFLNFLTLKLFIA